MFDKIIIAIGYNTNKMGYFPLEQRVQWIKNVFEGDEKIEVEVFESLTVDLCVKKKAQFILRGLRTSADFEYERAIGQMNRSMHAEIETVFFLTLPEHTHVTSTIVRDIIRYGGDASIFLPDKMKISQ